MILESPYASDQECFQNNSHANDCIIGEGLSHVYHSETLGIIYNNSECMSSGSHISGLYTEPFDQPFTNSHLPSSLADLSLISSSPQI